MVKILMFPEIYWSQAKQTNGKKLFSKKISSKIVRITSKLVVKNTIKKGHFPK